MLLNPYPESGGNQRRFNMVQFYSGTYLLGEMEDVCSNHNFQRKIGLFLLASLTKNIKMNLKSLKYNQKNTFFLKLVAIEKKRLIIEITHE